MRILLLLFAFAATSVFADPYDYVARKANQNKNLTILENKTDEFTAKDTQGTQFTLERSDVSRTIEALRIQAGMETDSIVEAVFAGKDLSYYGDLKVQYYLARSTRIACTTVGGACAVLAGTTMEFILPVVAGAACVAAATECATDASKLLDEVSAKLKAAEEQGLGRPNSGGFTSTEPEPGTENPSNSGSEATIPPDGMGAGSWNPGVLDLSSEPASSPPPSPEPQGGAGHDPDDQPDFIIHAPPPKTPEPPPKLEVNGDDEIH